MANNTNIFTENKKKRPIFKKELKFVDAESVLYALKHPEKWVVIDVRTKEEYQGVFTTVATNEYGRGRIKNAMHIDWFDLINEDFTIKSKTQVQEIFEDIIKEKSIILYCHSGIRSAHLQAFLIQELGYKEVYNYEESWTEWAYLASQESSDEIEEEMRSEILSYTENWSPAL